MNNVGKNKKTDQHNNEIRVVDLPRISELINQVKQHPHFGTEIKKSIQPVVNDYNLINDMDVDNPHYLNYHQRLSTAEHYLEKVLDAMNRAQTRQINENKNKNKKFIRRSKQQKQKVQNKIVRDKETEQLKEMQQTTYPSLNIDEMNRQAKSNAVNRRAQQLEDKATKNPYQNDV